MKSKIDDTIESLRACKKEVDLLNNQMLDPLESIHIPTSIVILVICILLIVGLSS